MEEILNKAKKQTEDLIGLVVDDLAGIKTGRAKPSLIENIKVEAYTSKMTLKELASISAPGPHSLIISPWDKTILEAIEKAVLASNLNLHPVVDNDLIRVQVPPLTEETRKDLVKLVAQKIESGRKLLRQLRNETKKEIEDLKGESGISEDDIKRWLENLQKLIDETTEKIEELGKAKEKELMTI
jgi:ribosome recycling factor